MRNTKNICKICKILCNKLHKTQKKLVNIVVYTFLLFDLNINAKKNPNKMTDESPAETAAKAYCPRKGAMLPTSP